MTNRAFSWLPRSAGLLLAGSLLTGAPALADGPGPDDAVVTRPDSARTAFPRQRRPLRWSEQPARVVTGDVGYVGSDWGLGKPSYTGIGSRPDWGRSSID
jgi:hypothetical protein